MKIFGKYFLNPTFLFQIQATSFRPSYLIEKNIRPENEKHEITGRGPIVSIDDLDYTLLQIIASQARIPLMEIVKKMKVSSNVIRYRMKKLEKLDVIQAYRTNIDITKLGYRTIKADLFLNNYGDRNRIIEYVRNNPYIVCIMLSFGYSHLELEFNVENMTHFYKIMQDLIDAFPNSINSYQYFGIMESHKLCYFPE
jgi:Lrp/AsnC family transcriptional regulator for asnA, asnC and gidA